MIESMMTFEEACKEYEKKTNTEKLLQLIRENPDLPVVPMVNEEVVADDSHSWWLANFGMCSIDSYYSDDERVWLKADDEEDLLDMWADEHYEELKDLSNAEAEKVVNSRGKEWFENLPWVKAIMVYIEL